MSNGSVEEFDPIIPPIESEEVDLGQLHQESETDRNIKKLNSELDQMLGPPPFKPAPGKQGVFETEEGRESGKEIASTIGREVRGLTTGIPKEVVGGALEGIKETGDAAREFGNWMDEVMPLGGVIVDDDGIHWGSGDEIEDTETLFGVLLPTIERPDSFTGNAVFGISQFLVGFMGARKALKPIEALGPITRAAAAGTIADFFVWDPHEPRLSNLIQEFPMFANPVTEFLAADPDDSVAMGRFKSAIEGFGLGIAAEGLLQGVRWIARRRAAKAKMMVTEEDVARVTAETVDIQRKQFVELGLDPEAPAVSHSWKEVDPDVPDVTQDLPTPRAAADSDEAPEGFLFHGRRHMDSYGEAERVEFQARFDSDDIIEGGLTRSLREAREFSRNNAGEAGDIQLVKISDLPDSVRAQVEQGKGFVRRVAEPVKAVEGVRGKSGALPEAPRAAVSPEVAQAREALENIHRMTVPELREAGIMPPKGGRKRDLIEAAEAKLSEAESGAAATADELLGDVTPEEAAAAIVAARAVPEGGRSEATGSGEVFINWARIDASDDIKAVTQDMADASADRIEQARRGVRTWEETKLSASQEDAWGDLVARRKDNVKAVALNAERTFALRELWISSTTKLQELAGIVNADPSNINNIAFMHQLETHRFIQEEVLAVRAEGARALNAWKIPAGDRVDFKNQFDNLQEIARLDGKNIGVIAKRIAMLSDANMGRELDAFVYGTRWAKTSGMIKQLFYFSLLSGPHTHMRNVISNTAVVVLQAAERKGANVLGHVLDQKHVPDGETTAALYGLVQGWRDAFRISAQGGRVAGQAVKALRPNMTPTGITAGSLDTARRILRSSEEEFGTFWRSSVTGESGLGIGKVEVPRLGAFDSQRLQIDPENPLGRVMSIFSDMTDGVTTLPFRALIAEDEVFKSLNFRFELHANAHRMAWGEVEKGLIAPDQLKGRIAELVNDPSEGMRMMASDWAKTSTFTNTPLDTGMWKAFSSIQKAPVIGRFIQPFVRTIYNMGVYAWRSGPLAPVTRKFREDIAAGGATAQLAWSKYLIGTLTFATLADLAIDGHITGEGPSDPRERAAKARLGWKPYSFRVQLGDDPDEPSSYRYFSIRGLEPVATPIGWAANSVEIGSEYGWDGDNPMQWDEMLQVSALALGEQMTSAQFVSGMSDFFETISDPRRYGESYFKRAFGIIVPTGFAHMARLNDPVARAVENGWDAMRARSPWHSKDLPINPNMWGQEISRESGLGDVFDFLSPIYSSRADPKDPAYRANKELKRLELWIGKPEKTLHVDGIEIDLQNRLNIWSRYVVLAGNEAKGGDGAVPEAGFMDSVTLLATGQHPNQVAYDLGADGPDGAKADYIELLQKNFKSVALQHLLVEFPELRAEIAEKHLARPVKFKIEEEFRGIGQR